MNRTVLSAFFMIISGHAALSQTGNRWSLPLKPFIFLHHQQYDTLLLQYIPADTLPYRNITLKGKRVFITTAAMPLVTDSGLQYKFLLAAFAGTNRHLKNITNQDGQNKFLQLTNTYDYSELIINGKPFTGVIKLYIDYTTTAAGFLCEFKEGKLFRKIQLPTVKNAHRETIYIPEESWDV